MDTIEDAIRRLIKEKYGSITKFAKEVNLPPTSVYSCLDRGIANTRTELSDTIYRALNVDWDTAKLGSDYRCLKLKVANPPNGATDVPLYNPITTDTLTETAPSEDTPPIPAAMSQKYPNAFLLRVEDESMNKVLPKRSYALIDPCDTVEIDEAPYAVRTNDHDATIRRVRKLNNGFQLTPDSTDPTYETEIRNYNEPNAQAITVMGRVVYYVLPLDWKF